jgi:methylmalonyl-CoA mutase N-terminal domain/subunit
MTDGPARIYKTQSGIPLKASYSAKDIPDWYKADVDISPGQLPYQRGAFAEGYRSKAWRIFQLSGFGKPEDENERIKFLLAQGETGFLMEHDRNTADHMYNVDHPEVLARKEDVGLTGAVMQSVRDMDICLKDLPIETTFGHAGGAVVQHAPFALAGYWTIAQRRGIDLSKLPGTGQSDFFLTYLGCVTKQQIPTAAGLRFNADIIEFCDQHLPRWVPVSIAGYNGADTGLNAYQELGSLFANAVEYLDEIKRRGTIPIESAAKACGGVSFRLSMDIFEEASKIRAARRMWSDLLERRYGITNNKVRQLRVHCVTSGSNMTYQQPMNNIVRGTVMALAGILGGIQSLGVSGYDEALSIPSEHAHQMSLRIQQVLQHETNIVAVTDPLGGSYYVESLTADLIERSWAFFDQIEAQGGFLETLNTGWLHARAHENQLDDFALQGTGEKIIVGVNDFREDISPFEIDGFRGVNDAFDVATERLADLRRTRAERPAADSLKALERACKGTDNIMPVMMEALAADVTVGEIGDIWRNVYGDWATPEITI